MAYWGRLRLWGDAITLDTGVCGSGPLKQAGWVYLRRGWRLGGRVGFVEWAGGLAGVRGALECTVIIIIIGHAPAGFEGMAAGLSSLQPALAWLPGCLEVAAGRVLPLTAAHNTVG